MTDIVATTSGKVRGVRNGDVTAFLGIPYAAAPKGRALFEPAHPVPAWDGVRDAVTLGPTAPKPGYAPPFDALLAEPVIAGDEFLNVNVWTPDPGGAGLPVMVWIHGGAFRNGSNAIPAYDGQAFARDGVVLVGVNYRLGVPGFAVLPDSTANIGIRDQLAALAWVQDNIAAFGGDPGNVTIFGESAGGMSVSTLLAVAAGSGLFHKVIAQSGAGTIAAELDDARRVTAELANRLGIDATADALAHLDVDAVIDAQQAVALDMAAHPDPSRWGPSIVATMMTWVPVVDGELITERPQDAIAAGIGHEIPLLIGTTTEEQRFFLVPTGMASATTPDVLRGLSANRGWPTSIADVYTANRPDASAGDVLCAALTDQFFRVPALRLAEGRADATAPTFVYEFDWGTPVQDLGACHALEIGFVFDNLAVSGQMAGANPPQELASDMHARWIAFARGGDPGWEAYSVARRAVMRFASPASGVVLDPRGDERVLWDGIV